MNSSQKTLLERINRKLAHYGKGVRWNDDENERQQSGDFYILDLNRNAKMGHVVDLEQYAKEVGVLDEKE